MKRNLIRHGLVLSVLWLTMIVPASAVLSTNDHGTFVRAIQYARNLLDLPPTTNTIYVLRTHPTLVERPRFFHGFTLETEDVEVTITAKDGRFVQVLDANAIRARSKVVGAYLSRKHMPKAIPNLTREDAESRARALVEKIGVKLDENFRPWERFYSVPTNNYHSGYQDWTFIWNRHIRDVPVCSEVVTVKIDDASGKVFNCAISIHTNLTFAPIARKITVNDARRIALEQALKLPADQVSDMVKRWEAYPPIPDGNPLCYFVHDEQDPEKIRKSGGTLSKPKLRLIFIVLIGYFEPDSSLPSGKRFMTEKRVMIDAVTGEFVGFD